MLLGHTPFRHISVTTVSFAVFSRREMNRGGCTSRALTCLYYCHVTSIILKWLPNREGFPGLLVSAKMGRYCVSVSKESYLVAFAVDL